ncbi:MAG: ArsA-related P-loop ATPase [bacterium]|nr:ArsA-related P-loop ATPase [bacterium]
MKIAISGKGGVGKTTLTAALACLYGKEGSR